MRLASWTNKGLDWGSPAEVMTLQKRIKIMIGKNTSLTDVIQVMLFRRILPCQHRSLHMWEYNPEGPRTLQRLFDTMHEEIWKLLFKAQKTWPKKTDGIGLDSANPSTPVSILFPNITSIHKSKGILCHSGLDNKGGADQVSSSAT